MPIKKTINSCGKNLNRLREIRIRAGMNPMITEKISHFKDARKLKLKISAPGKRHRAKAKKTNAYMPSTLEI